MGHKNAENSDRFQADVWSEQPCQELPLNCEAILQVLHLLVSDCTFMQLKCHSLVSNMFLHNVRELLENAELGEEACSLAEIVELSLLNQSKLIARIILGRMI